MAYILLNYAKLSHSNHVIMSLKLASSLIFFFAPLAGDRKLYSTPILNRQRPCLAHRGHIFSAAEGENIDRAAYRSSL